MKSGFSGPPASGVPRGSEAREDQDAPRKRDREDEECLMTFFFENLSKGQNKAEALRGAKLKIIKERREDFAVAHPFFWAAFTLTGDAGQPSAK
jgi:hypothetical protein